jgi:drug/metabolite transporter (DMT)-like permease
MGLQRETASRGTLAIYSKMIFATMLERIVFHTLPTFLSVVGTLMIVISALYIVVRS